MSEAAIRENSLVLYRARPARVLPADEKLTLELRAARAPKCAPRTSPYCTRAAEKPGRAAAGTGDVQTAWEILAGSDTTLAELAELAFGAFTPSSAWAAWQLRREGLYFRGTRAAFRPAPPTRWPHVQAARAAEAAEKQAWEAFVARARPASPRPRIAATCARSRIWRWAAATRSRVLQALGREEQPENAHATCWSSACGTRRSTPTRRASGLNLTPPELPLPDRRDDPARATARRTRGGI